jgi:predicted CXXCH cytochrome family protein
MGDLSKIKTNGHGGEGSKVPAFFIPAFFIFAILQSAALSWAQTAPPVPPGTVDVLEDITKTRHNLSPTGPGDVKVPSTPGAATSEICIFCHTPHGGSQVGKSIQAPLWNRNLKYRETTGYALYDGAWSYSFEGNIESPGTKPTGYSRLCLSCHDGVIAIGTVINKPGSGGFRDEALPPTEELGIGKMGDQPSAQGFDGVLSGDTRVLGVNLQNDHPISFVFDSTLATSIDTELVDPGPPPNSLNAITPLAPAGGYKTGVKRFPGNDLSKGINEVQCTSCHNPHTVTYPKFLRAPRLQDAEETGYLPDGTGSAPAGQLLCLYCHSKPGWDGSTHDRARAIRAAYPIKDDPATKHPENYDFDGIHTVGEVGCRNCHDPHTAQGAKRLHREGVTAFGGGSAIENTCFLCHSPNESAVTPAQTFAPAGDPTDASIHRFCDPTHGDPTNYCPEGTSVYRIAPDIWSQFDKDSTACIGGGGGGSAMCLQLPTLQSSHEPVFVFRSQEGIQLDSHGVLNVPANNEDFPGVTVADEPHVECVDCHNPHQINSPHFASLAFNGADPPNAKGGRLKGMKGIGIDSTGTRAIVVGRFGMTDIDIDGNSANRDPYVYEICFRCHGNSYENMFRPNRNPDDVVSLTIPPGYTSRTSVQFSPRTDPTNAPASVPQMSFKGFSNKWLEFNPETDDRDRPKMVSVDLARFGQPVSSHTNQPKNPAYHPVVRPGRNGSPQLCNQFAVSFNLDCGAGPGTTVDEFSFNVGAATNALSNLTILCTDCHNNDYYNAYKTGVLDTSFLGPLTESNLRPTDRFPADLGRTVGLAQNYNDLRVREPIGPHGSVNRRLLRANYDTDILKPGRCFEQNNPPGCSKGDGYSSGSPSHGIAGGGGGVDSTHYDKFLLCFNCHDRRAFDPSIEPTTGDRDRRWTRFFGTAVGAPNVDSWWEGNLHMYHLRWSGAMCHECHYNIHSNVEGLNTIYGDGTGGALAPDSVDGMSDGVSGTHLINFAPTVEGTTGIKPIWFYDGTEFRCYLRCHNEVMDSCAYQAQSSGTPNARWCAGGRNPGTAG